MASSLVWCKGKSWEAEGCGSFWAPWRKCDLKTFRKEEPISCKRPRSNPGLSGQPRNTFKCKDYQSSSCSAASKPGHLLGTAGKTVSSSSKRALRNTEATQYRFPQPRFRQTELISRMERNICGIHGCTSLKAFKIKSVLRVNMSRQLGNYNTMFRSYPETNK